METAVVNQFLDFFQDFLKLCQLEHWPSDDTSESEVRNAFAGSQHIAICLNKLQNKELIKEFVSTLDNNFDETNDLLKYCLIDPPKYILKKIVNSKCSINKVDIAFKIFLEMFGEDKLEDYLSELMLETASKETLLMNLSNLPKDKVLHFKSQLLLLEIGHLENKNKIVELLKYCDAEIFEMLIVCLLIKDFKYAIPVCVIADSFIDVMVLKNTSCRKFWSMFFASKSQYLQSVYLNHENIFKAVINTILDCGKLLRESMSMKYFYIDLTYTQLVLVVRNITQNENLKLELFDILKENNTDINFWEQMLS